MVKRLHRYLIGQLLKALVPSLIGLTLLTLLGLSAQAVYEGFDIVRLRGMIPYFALWAMPTVLPAALLTATVMVYGRLEGDNELLALRSSGVHLFEASTPGLFMGAMALFICTGLTNKVIPWSNLRSQLARQKALKELLGDEVMLNSKRSLSIHPFRVRYDKYSKGVFHGVNVWRAGATGINTDVRAKQGRIEFDPEGSDLNIILEGCQITYYMPEDIRRLPKEIRAETLTLSTKLYLDASYFCTKPKYMSTDELVGEMQTTEQQDPPAGVDVQDPELLRDPHRHERRVLRKFLGTEMEMLELRNRLRPRENNVKELEKEVEQLVSNSATLQKEISSLKQSLAKSESEAKRLRSELAKQTTGAEAAANLKEQLSVQKGMIDAARDKIDKLQQQLNEHNDRQARCNRMIGRESTALLAQQSKYDELVATKSRLRTELKFFQSLTRRFEIHTRIHKRFSQAASCLSFVLVGIPVGMLTRRGNIIAAFGISFGFVLLIYYPLLMLGEFISERGALSVPTCMWAPNAIASLIGLLLFMRVYRR